MLVHPDAETLLFLCAIVKECIRWLPTTIMAAPHTVTPDDEYTGYKKRLCSKVVGKSSSFLAFLKLIKILKGTAHGYHHGPRPKNIRPITVSRRPSRKAKCATARNPLQRRNHIFSAGRCVCQGTDIAERSLFLAVTRLLWAFDLKTLESRKGPDVDDLEGKLTV